MNEPILIVRRRARRPHHRARAGADGWPVRVLEGAPEFGAIGYGIQFGPNVFHVLDRIGVSTTVLEKSDAPPAIVMIDALTAKR